MGSERGARSGSASSSWSCSSRSSATHATLFGGGRVGTSFPISGIILGVLVLVYGFVTQNTIFGRHIYAVGGNRHAAELSGVKAKRVNFFVMMNMSVLAALAGMIFVARATASGPQDGLGWELDAIAVGLHRWRRRRRRHRHRRSARSSVVSSWPCSTTACSSSASAPTRSR